MKNVEWKITLLSFLQEIALWWQSIWWHGLPRLLHTSSKRFNVFISFWQDRASGYEILQHLPDRGSDDQTYRWSGRGAAYGVLGPRQEQVHNPLCRIGNRQLHHIVRHGSQDANDIYCPVSLHVFPKPPELWPLFLFHNPPHLHAARALRYRLNTHLIESARPFPSRTAPLLEMIREEAEDYFNGTKSAEEVIGRLFPFSFFRQSRLF